MFKIERFFNPDKEKMDTYVTGHAVTGHPAEFSITKSKNRNGVFEYQFSGSLTFWDKKEKSFKTFPFCSLYRPAEWCASNLTQHVATIFIVDGTVHTRDDNSTMVDLWVQNPIMVNRHYLDPAGPSFGDVYSEMLEGLKSVKAPRYERTFLTALHV
jgi:hypothetical protein